MRDTAGVREGVSRLCWRLAVHTSRTLACTKFVMACLITSSLLQLLRPTAMWKRQQGVGQGSVRCRGVSLLSCQGVEGCVIHTCCPNLLLVKVQGKQDCLLLHSTGTRSDLEFCCQKSTAEVVCGGDRLLVCEQDCGVEPPGGLAAISCSCKLDGSWCPLKTPLFS